MNDELQALYAILESVDTKINSKLKQINYNYYLTGKIMAINNDVYTVQINGELYDMKARTGLTLQLSDVVQVLIKNNDFSRKFIDDKNLC